MKDNPGHAMEREEYNKVAEFVERLGEIVPGATVVSIRAPEAEGVSK